MKRLSRRDLELLGDRVTKAYMDLPENKGKQIFRIDPELLCERLLGLKLDYRHLSALRGLELICHGTMRTIASTILTEKPS